MMGREVEGGLSVPGNNPERKPIRGISSMVTKASRLPHPEMDITMG
jgi:hypothetical protein